MKRQAYSKYKPSGIEWLGKIPEHWRLLSIKRLSLVKRGASPRPIDDPKYFDEKGEYAWVRIADVTASYRYLKSTTQLLSELGKRLSVPLEYGDIFLSIAGTVGKPIITKIKCCIHDGFVYFPQYRENKEFLYYIFASGHPYHGLGKWGTQLNLNTDTVGGIHIGLPARDEQEEIVAYLDRETARIDALIEKKERQIELLREKRTALISHAVTKGLNPNARMKDSGIEWLGKIPEHWDMVKLRHFGLFCKGRGISRTDITDSGFPAITYGDIYTICGIETDHLNKFTSESVAINAQEIINGDLLFTASGETIEEIGKTTLYSGDEPAYAGGDIIILKLDEGHGLFLSYVLNSEMGIRQKRYFGRGDIIVHISSSNLKQLIVPTPPPFEQQSIANYLNKETARIDTLIEKIKKSISLLREYRTAIISAAVTGKIDVRRNDKYQTQKT